MRVIFVTLCLAVCVTVLAAKAIRIDVVQEKAGGEPTHFLAMVGNWVVAQDEGKNILMVDGRQWKRGQPAGGLADKARLIYGSRHGIRKVRESFRVLSVCRGARN